MLQAMRSLLFFSLGIGLVASCGPAASTSDDGSTRYVAPAAGEEHEVSPLAQLMRDMTAFADSARARIADGRDLPPFPAHFKDMLTAEPTPGMVDHRTYDPFAFAYLFQVDSLYRAAPADRQEVFNAVVAGCAACHGEVCPGPLVRINKLYAR
jgi:hypothetical protein